jgi:hypothetical protein
MMDLTGKVFGKLVVLNNFYIKKTSVYWECLCDCGNKKFFSENNLMVGHNTTCGICRKTNIYEFYEGYAIGILNNKDSFMFDPEDYDLIKRYKWYENEEGYIFSYIDKKKHYLHRLVMGLNSYDVDKILVDHINRNVKDNRKENLRLATRGENKQNGNLRVNNLSGYIGVHIYKKYNKYNAFIAYKGKDINLGYYENIEDAIAARLQAEKKYFGEFAPQKHLFEQYGIV